MEERTTMSEAQRLARRRKIQKARRRRAVLTTILVVLLLSAIAVAAFFVKLYQDEKAKVAEANNEVEVAKQEAAAANQSYEELQTKLKNDGFITIEEAQVLSDKASEATVEEYRSRIRGYMESGDGTLKMLENLFEDMIIVPDTGKYAFFDIDENLAKSVIDLAKLSYPEKNEESGQYEGNISYSGDSEIHFGVDVSKFQGDIDWDKIKNDNIDYAYIRLGYRGYESGKIVTDDNYEKNIEGCNEAGLDCGVYFFTEAKNREEGIEEAEFVLENLGDYHVELPIVIDVELSSNVKKSRTRNLSQEDRTEAVIGFCERIKKAGYTPMIYGNLKSLMLMTDINKLEDYDKWFAYYNYPLRFPYKIKMWQYTSEGSVDGIKGNADINIMFY